MGLLEEQIKKLERKQKRTQLEEEFFKQTKVMKGDRGDKGDNGDKGDKGERGEQGMQGIQGVKGEKGDRGERGLQGERGKDGRNGKDGQEGKDGKDGKDGSPDTPQQIKTKLETLRGNDRLDASAIKNLPTALYGKKRLGRGTGSPVFTSDLSSQCDGANKTFTIPTNTRVLLLIGTDFPILYRPTTDYTVSGTTLTLTSAVNAPSSGATLSVLYVE